MSNLLKRSPPQSIAQDPRHIFDQNDDEDEGHVQNGQRQPAHNTDDMTEQTPLLQRVISGSRRSYKSDLEGQKPRSRRPWLSSLVEVGHKVEERIYHAANPERWDRKALWDNCVISPVSCLPAVAVGLLLNILDALSYGKSKFTTIILC